MFSKLRKNNNASRSSKNVSSSSSTKNVDNPFHNNNKKSIRSLSQPSLLITKQSASGGSRSQRGSDDSVTTEASTVVAGGGGGATAASNNNPSRSSVASSNGSRNNSRYNNSYYSAQSRHRFSSMPCLSVDVPSTSTTVSLAPPTASMMQARAAVEALDYKLVESIKHSWDLLVTQVPGDYKQQLGKQILFTIAGLEANTCEILGLESVLRPPAKVFSVSHGFSKALEDLVTVLDPIDPDPLLTLAPVLLERRGGGFCMALLFPAFCQAVPTAVRRLLHGDWNDQMEQDWKAFMECALTAICAQLQQEEEQSMLLVAAAVEV